MHKVVAGVSAGLGFLIWKAIGGVGGFAVALVFMFVVESVYMLTSGSKDTASAPK